MKPNLTIHLYTRDECRVTPILRYTNWCRIENAKIDFFMRRKEWARKMFEESGQPWEPGREVTGEFEGIACHITIGPRLGLRVKSEMPDWEFKSLDGTWHVRNGRVCDVKPTEVEKTT